ncbi:MAG TPA: transcription antitermination factor NusB [Victivallales bacterium]|nr:transcription antitermination factor NusB [Victivallales bacterium]HPO91143.1 transcription antitermination factor NusB [Victivallales bacterium]HRR29573.1 transcription antitermination factor NusB [Victivallales bacterium]
MTKFDYRRKARQLAIQFFFQYDYSEGNFEEDLLIFWENIRNFEPDLPHGKKFEKIKNLSDKFINTYIQNKKMVDEKIQSFAKNWRLERMAVVDRNIMRLAVSEMLFIDEIPPVVSINEALELSKKYGSETSPVFINGILNSVKNTLNRPPREPLKKEKEK